MPQAERTAGGKDREESDWVEMFTLCDKVVPESSPGKAAELELLSWDWRSGSKGLSAGLVRVLLSLLTCVSDFPLASVRCAYVHVLGCLEVFFLPLPPSTFEHIPLRQ